MSVSSNRKKSEALGMPFGTAQNQLRKMILFNLLKEHAKNVCYRCSQVIESEVTLSIEHKKPWAGDPELFWNLENIAFSHLKCNEKASVPSAGHGTFTMYRKGCRCELCKLKMDNYYQSKRKT